MTLAPSAKCNSHPAESAFLDGDYGTVRRRNVIVLLAHPHLSESRVNRRLADAARGIDGVTVHDLYENYARFNIDVDREQQLLCQNDVVVLQFPLYWYSMPALLKEWQDVVLTRHFAYGTGGVALHGKVLQVVTSAAGSTEDYSSQGYNQVPLPVLLAPLSRTANFIGMAWPEPMCILESKRLTNSALDTCIAGYVELLHCYVRCQ